LSATRAVGFVLTTTGTGQGDLDACLLKKSGSTWVFAAGAGQSIDGLGSAGIIGGDVGNNFSFQGMSGTRGGSTIRRVAPNGDVFAGVHVRGTSTGSDDYSSIIGVKYDDALDQIIAWIPSAAEISDGGPAKTDTGGITSGITSRIEWGIAKDDRVWALRENSDEYFITMMATFNDNGSIITGRTRARIVLETATKADESEFSLAFNDASETEGILVCKQLNSTTVGEIIAETMRQ